MKIPACSPFLFAFVGAATLLSAALYAQAPAPAPSTVGTPGIAQPLINFYRGTSRAPFFDDMQLTAITKMEESFEKEANAVNPARDAMLQATFVQPRNDALIKSKLDALMNAELALALKRAESFAKFQATTKLTPAQLDALAANIASQQIGTIPRGSGPSGGPPPIPMASATAARGK